MSTQLAYSATRLIRHIIQEADHSPDPETALRNAARATTILGKMLEDMADRSAPKASKAGRLVRNFGLLGYGLVEISVPRSLWSHITTYWLQLLTLIATTMFALGLILRSPDTWKIGLGVMVFAWLASGLRDLLRLVMQRRPVAGWALAIQWRLLLLFVCIAVLAVANAQLLNRLLSATGGRLIGLQMEILNLLHSVRGH
jgi:hypothetical protein